MELRNLSDKELLLVTAETAFRERGLTLELMRVLREVDRRQLFIELGYSSLYDFVTRELKISEGATYRRIQAMRLIRDVPEVEDKIATGRLSIHLAARVQSVAAKWPVEDKVKLIERVEGKSAREAEREFAKADPKGPKETTKWLDGENVQIGFSLTRETFKSLQELLSIRTHVDIAKTYKVIFTDLVELGQKQWNPLQRNADSASSLHCVKEGDEYATISPKLRDAVWKRDGGVCTYVNPENGARCTSTDLLQIDHIHPLALGGKNELSNLRLLCAQHNRRRAAKTYGEDATGSPT